MDDIERELEAVLQGIPADQVTHATPVADPNRARDVAALLGGGAAADFGLPVSGPMGVGPGTPARSGTGGGPLVIEGVALDAALGAVVREDGGQTHHLFGLHAWPSEVYGKRVRVTGTSGTADLAPDPTRDADGGYSHGMVGRAGGLYDARWEVLD